jgi:hypothetical protein
MSETETSSATRVVFDTTRGEQYFRLDHGAFRRNKEFRLDLERMRDSPAILTRT